MARMNYKTLNYERDADIRACRAERRAACQVFQSHQATLLQRSLLWNATVRPLRAKLLLIKQAGPQAKVLSPAHILRQS